MTVEKVGIQSLVLPPAVRKLALVIGGIAPGMPKGKYKDAKQYGVLPWRIGTGGKREVMLLTSRETRRWVIPKGWPMKGKKPAEAAAQEAYEEAGLIGQVVGKRPIGSYHYEKRTRQGTFLCEVRVYLLRVERQLDDWPEKVERTTAWFEATEAADLVQEGGLAEIIRRFGGSAVRLIVHRSSRRARPMFAGIRTAFTDVPSHD